MAIAASAAAIAIWSLFLPSRARRKLADPAVLLLALAVFAAAAVALAVLASAVAALALGLVASADSLARRLRRARTA